MQVEEFFAHLILARKRIAADQIRLVSSIGLFSPYLKPELRSTILKAIRDQQKFGDGDDDVRSLYENLSLEDRLKTIGSALSSDGASVWRQAGHGQLEWLAENGFTENDARKAYEDWVAHVEAIHAKPSG